MCDAFHIPHVRYMLISPCAMNFITNFGEFRKNIKFAHVRPFGIAHLGYVSVLMKTCPCEIFTYSLLHMWSKVTSPMWDTKNPGVNFRIAHVETDFFPCANFLPLFAIPHEAIDELGGQQRPTSRIRFKLFTACSDSSHGCDVLPFL